VYLIGLALVVRTGFLLVQASQSTAALVKPTLTFAASAFGTLVAAVGLWLTEAHQRRADRNEALKTVATGLGLLSEGAEYSPSATVAGALATLIHLDQPVIAIRSLRAAWHDGAVDTETVTWLIGEVLESGDLGSQFEAARLLYTRAADLVAPLPDGSLEVHWPYRLYEYWPGRLPREARIDLLRTMIAMLVSRPYQAWQKTRYSWMIALIDEAIQADPSAELRAQAGRLQDLLLRGVPDSRMIGWRGRWKSVRDMRVAAQRAREHRDYQLSPFRQLEGRLRGWNSPSREPLLRSLAAAYQGGDSNGRQRALGARRALASLRRSR
jgi:hypothetical protein